MDKNKLKEKLYMLLEEKNQKMIEFESEFAALMNKFNMLSLNDVYGLVNLRLQSVLTERVTVEVLRQIQAQNHTVTDKSE